MIFVTGDMHGNVKNIKRFDPLDFPAKKNLTKKDYVIVCGDFGGLFFPYDHERAESDRKFIQKLSEEPFTTLFVDGNHENFDNLNSLPRVEMFGDVVGKINDSIYHLRRGKIYNINKKKILTLGGACSIDKLHRLALQPQYDFKLWWEEEEWSEEEKESCVENLRKIDGKVDYVISHALPYSILKSVAKKLRLFPESDNVSSFFDRLLELEEIKEFKKWYCGHYHADAQHYQYHILYEKVRRLI